MRVALYQQFAGSFEDPGIPIYEWYTTVFRLAIHLENGQSVYFTSINLAKKLSNPPHITVLAVFELLTILQKNLLYPEVPSYFVWKDNNLMRRKPGKDVDGWPGVKKDHVLQTVYIIH